MKWKEMKSENTTWMRTSAHTHTHTHANNLVGRSFYDCWIFCRLLLCLPSLLWLPHNLQMRRLKCFVPNHRWTQIHFHILMKLVTESKVTQMNTRACNIKPNIIEFSQNKNKTFVAQEQGQLKQIGAEAGIATQGQYRWICASKKDRKCSSSLRK